MAIAIDIEAQRRDEPAWGGLFYALDVAGILSATDGEFRGDSLDFGPRVVLGWGRRGFFGMEKNEYARNRAFIWFGGVITSRAIALLLSYGIRIGRIQDAHEYLRDATALEFPFAARRFWVASDGFSDAICTELDGLLVTAGRHGKIPFTELMHGRIGDPGDMEFGASGGEFATKWELAPGVVINPGVQSGAACVKGTRTPTYVLYGGYVAGESVESLSCWYELEHDQVKAALGWEERLAAVGSA